MEVSDLDDYQCIEVVVNSIEDYEGEQFLSPKHGKRSSTDVQENSPKKFRPDTSNRLSPRSGSSDEGSSNRTKKNASKARKSKTDIDSAELKNVLDGMDDEIDNVLEETAQKNGLTATNVKNILRHVITNEYVLAMVRNTMKAENNEGDELEEAIFEPKLTRSKVKELREKQHMLQWPMSTPVKQAEPETKALLEEEFPDESSSDEDYKPNEEECPSEEENVASSPKSTDLDSSVCEKLQTPVTKPEEECEDDIGLVIALPEPEPEPLSEGASIDNEIEIIGLRTRSKLPMNDTPWEAIGASFVAPDITEDMYDTKCDDEEWQKFLQSLCQPLDATAAVEKPGEEPDDPEEDPEYIAMEDEDIPDELDFRFDNSVKIPRDELNALMAEIYEYDLTMFHDIEDEDEDTEVSVREATPVPEGNENAVKTETAQIQWMTNEERLQLEEQMRMYIQLITQFYVVSFGVPELNFINITSKIFLDEIKYFASHSSTVNERSAFYAHNLDDALEIVKEYESNKNMIRPRPKLKRKDQRPGIASFQAKKTMFSSKVFIYPELLPHYGFHRDVAENKKALFCASEDNLIALGLEEFSFLPTPVHYIQTLLLPCKTEEQIKVRIKNCRKKATIENPIKYYLTHKKALPFPRSVKIFDPDNVKPPKDYPPEVLPRWMRVMCNPVPSKQRILPKLTKPTAPVNPVNCPPRRKLRKLLPRIVHFSPLKHISPILKKYSQKRLMPLSFATGTNLIRKNVQFANRVIILKSPISLKTNGLKERIRNDSENNNLLTRIQNENEDANPNSATEPCTVDGKISKEAECLPGVGINECDSHAELDECDEEINDDEPESSTQHGSTLTNNIINKKHSVNKKKNKQQRDLESSLALLKPHLIENDPKREVRENLFANSYLLRVTEALKDDIDTCEYFFKILRKNEYSTQSPVKLYYEIKEILKDYPALADDFVAFLTPEQAKECGKYKEFLLLSKIRAFIRKVEVHFQNQPQHLLKILRTFAQFKQQSSITSAEVLSILQPLLKNQSHLTEELTNLLPDMAPCETLMTDFEEVTIPNSDDDNSSVSCEEIAIPEIPDLYGGKDCPCECHTSSTETKVLNKIRHCVKCGVKFMDGRVYIQTGKVLKPAQVVYQNELPEPVPVPKTAAKNKQSNTTSSVKNSVASDQSSKQEVSPVKKDTVKTPPATFIHPSVLSPDEPLPSTSKLPCDVIEDTVFPSVPVESKKSVPPDFSHLKDVIGPATDKNGSLNGNSVQDNPAEISNTAEQSSQLPETAAKKTKWNREEDKLIIYNCQRFGVTEKAFETSAAAIKSRTIEEIRERFLHMMDLLAKELNV